MSFPSYSIDHCGTYMVTLSYLIIGPVLLLIFGKLVLRFSLIRCGPIITFWYFGPADLLLDPGPFIRFNIENQVQIEAISGYAIETNVREYVLYEA